MGLRTRWTTAVAAALVVGMVGAAPAHAGPSSPPVAVPDTASTVVGTAVRIDPVANDTHSEGIALSLFGVPTVTSGSATVSVEGVEVVITPLAGTSTPLALAYVVTDGTTPTPGTITVDVLDNQAPVAVPDVAQMYSGSQLQVDPRANDTDPDGEALTVSSAGVSAGAGTVTTDGQVLAIGVSARAVLRSNLGTK